MTKLLCWNVNGLRSVLGKGFIDLMVKESPDIVCLQETKAKEIQVTNLLEPLASEYAFFFSDAEKPGYSGVATFVKRSLLPANPKVIAKLGEPKFDSEGRFLVITFPDFDLYNIYFPSGTSGESRQGFKYEFLDFVLAKLKALSPKELGRVVICGDFNICHRAIDIHHPDEATKRQLTGFLPAERAWMDKLVAQGMIDVLRVVHGDQPKMYTWWSFRANSRQKNLGWRIDYFFVGPDLRNKVKDAQIYPQILGSDHCPLILELK